MCTTYHYLVFFLATLLCNARPVNPTNNLSTRFVETIFFDGSIRAVKQLPEYGIWSTTYKIIHGFRNQPAILKVTNKKGDHNGVVRKEIQHTKTVGLWLYNEMIDNRYYIALKDVRTGINGGPPLEHFSEWYLKGMYTDLIEDLDELRRNVELSLVQFAVEKKLLYYDIQFRNIFVDATFTSIMPVDWRPQEGPYSVVELESVSESRLQMFRRELAIILPKRLNVNQLAINLAAQGRRLDPDDEIPSKILGEDDAEYDILPLIHMYQGRSSETFEIIGGYLGAAAILNVIERHKDRQDQSIRAEFGYLRKVGLILDSEMSEGDFSFVVKDLRRGNFPNRGDPPLKPFHELYLEDERMAVKGNLIKFRRSVKTRLVKFARDHGLLYLGYDFTNIFTDKEFNIVMPVDWAPEGDGQLGVRRVNPRSEEIVQYENDLDKGIGMMFNIGRLEAELKRHGEMLRLSDSERRVETIDGKKYDLVPVGVENLGAAFCATYKFGNGYQGQDAILELMRDVAGPPAFEDLIYDEIDRLKKNGEHLYDNREGQYWYIIAKDTHPEE